MYNHSLECVNSTACPLYNNTDIEFAIPYKLRLVNNIYLVLLGTFSVFIVLGNGLVIIVICARRRLRAQVSPNWFVLSLAVADFLVGLFSFTNSIMCKFINALEEICSIPKFYYTQNFLMSVFYTASVMNLCTLTLDIYLGVIHPYKYQTFKRTSTVTFFIAIAWFLSVVQNIPLVVYQMSDSHPREALLADNVIQIAFMTGLPNVFMFYAYGRIFHVAAKHRKDIEKMQNEVNTYEPLTKKRRRSKERRSGTIKSVGVVVGIFLFCNLFYQYYVVCEIFEKLQTNYIVNVVVLLLRHFNSAPNILVYAFMRKDFRREMMALLQCCRPQERRQSTDIFTL